MTFAELHDRVTRIAADDPEFRRRLLADPRGALEARFAGELRELDGVRLEVIQETAALRYLVLPYEAAPEGRLEESQLDQVVGAGNYTQAHPQPPPPTQNTRDPACAAGGTGSGVG